MRASDFDFQLPTQLVAQIPAPARDDSRLLVFNRAKNIVSHHSFKDLPAFLRPGDLLVLNDSKVIAARLRGFNPLTGGEFEALLLEENSLNNWWAMMRPGKRAPVGTRIHFKTRAGVFSGVVGTVIETNSEGHRRLVFDGCENIFDELARIGEVPLPPYIKRGASDDADLVRYQTVYAREPGSVAAPTAGLHFTPALFDALRGAGAEVCHVTLHVGPGTFAPVKQDDLACHQMHEERFVVSAEAAARLNAAKAAGRRIIAVGTTSARVLETVIGTETAFRAGPGRTRIFIHPPYQFRAIDALVTNFHLPRSTLLMLVSAFAAPGESRGLANMLAVYEEAIALQYRFFSYGDAMLIV
ncbi:MAG: S-adenosylmethionine:tRNA ribosyltransferase-isomerase [Verrucomicrobiota bacterium]